MSGLDRSGDLRVQAVDIIDSVYNPDLSRLPN